MKVISPFGPKIAKLKFSNKLIKKINFEVDQILDKKSLLKKLDYSRKLVGQVRQEFQLPKIFIKKSWRKYRYFDARSNSSSDCTACDFWTSPNGLVRNAV